MSKKVRLRKSLKKVVSFTVALSMAAGLIAPSVSTTTVNAASETTATAETETDYNYARAFQQTLMFYEFQMSGDVSELVRNNWIDDCDLEDGSDVGLDLTGGWHDAGDHVKFNLPMSYSATMLAWSYLEYQDAYEESGQDKYMLQQLRWVNDYFIKCHPEKYVYYYQVGDGDIDHQLWTAPCLFDDDETMVRPSFKVDLEHGGSAVCAGTAASLAAAAIIFKESDPEYAELCLKHADELYEFALITQTDLGYSGDNNCDDIADDAGWTEEERKVYQKGAGYYTSTHFEDELSWGGAWLCKATGNMDYLETAKSYGHRWGGEEIIGNLKGNTWTQCWDDVRYGAMLLIAELDDSEEGLEYRDGIEYNLDYMSIGTEDGGAKNKRTPQGLIMINDWGSLRYAAAAAFLAMLYAKWEDADPDRVKAYKEFAKSQADYILGSTGRSYIVGYDETSPQNPHHRAAHGAWKNSPLGYPESNRHVLVGAMVGGPLSDDSYIDDRNKYCMTEVSCDYNAGALGLMSAMYAEYGGEIDPDLSAYEIPGREFTMSAGLYQHGTKDGGNYFEIKDCLINQTAWPSRVTDNLKYRVYVDISDVLEQGYTPEDFNIISYYSQYMPAQDQISGLLPYDKEKGIYYVEVDLSGAKMMPAGDVISRNDMQLYIGAPCEWDYMKSPSLQPILDTDGDTLIPNFRITVYEGDVKVFGYEPNEEMPKDPESANTLMGTPISNIPANSPTTENPEATTESNATATTAADNKTTQEAATTTSDENAIAVKAISIQPESITLQEGETAVLESVFTPSDATNKKVTWRIGNPSVALVDENGQVTAIKAGNASVFVIADDGSYAAVCKVKVIQKTQNEDGSNTTAETPEDATTAGEPNATTAADNKTTQAPATTANADKTTQKPATTASADKTTQKPATTASADKTTQKPATTESVDKTTQKPATTESADKTTQKPATTESADKTTQKPATTASADKTTQKPATTASADKTTQKPATTASADKTTQKPATTASADKTTQAPATTASENKTTQALATTAADNKTTQDVTGTTSDENTIAVKAIGIQPASITLQEGKTAALKPIFTPSNATNKNVTWRTGNPSVVLVDENGQLTGIKAGNTNVFVTAEDGSITAVCKVQVIENTQNEDSSNTTTETTEGDVGDATTAGAPNKDDEGNVTTQTPAGDVADATTAGAPNKDDEGNVTTQTPAGDVADATTAGAPNKDDTGNVTTQTPAGDVADATTAGAPNKDNAGNAADQTPGANTANSTTATVPNTTTASNAAGQTGANAATANNASSATNYVTNYDFYNLSSYKPAKVTGLKKKKVKSTSFTLRWKKQSGVTGYCIYRYNKKTKKYNLVKKVAAKKNSVVIKKCKKNTSYKYRVAAYKKVGSYTVVGKPSKALTIKTKK